MPLSAQHAMAHTALRIEFGSDRFSFAQAAVDPGQDGPAFAGEDLCAWLCAALPQWPLDYLQEDWGWLIGSDRSRAAQADTDHQLCVYAYPPGTADSDGRRSESGEWMLVLHTRTRSLRRNWLRRLVEHWEYTAFDPALAADVIAALRTLDARDLRASAMQMDSAGNATGSTPYLPERLPL